MIPVWGTSTGAAHRILIVAFGSTVKAPSTHHGLSFHPRNQANQDFTWALPGTARLESHSGIFTVEGRHLSSELCECDSQICGWVDGWMAQPWPATPFQKASACPNNASTEPHVPIPHIRFLICVWSVGLDPLRCLATKPTSGTQHTNQECKRHKRTPSF